ncbi:MAG TPA: nitroreductase/quinone reductase family protein [Myxococcota bacterium]|nr:nitroreductase/quinone reductase family protein [Myxococcota bacterium]
MRALKIVLALAVSYVALVVGFESLLGWVQPASGATIVITTVDPDGRTHERVVARLDSDGKLYVAANHWPRSWYRRALENPAVQVASGGEHHGYRAVPVSGEEAERVDSQHPRPLLFKFVTGFPPRLIMRLDPTDPAQDGGAPR